MVSRRSLTVQSKTWGWRATGMIKVLRTCSVMLYVLLFSVTSRAADPCSYENWSVSQICGLRVGDRFDASKLAQSWGHLPGALAGFSPLVGIHGADLGRSPAAPEWVKNDWLWLREKSGQIYRIEIARHAGLSIRELSG